jgi:hypothetical protein
MELGMSHEFGAGIFEHKRIISAVNRDEFVSDKMPYLVLRNHWFHIIVLNFMLQLGIT